MLYISVMCGGSDSPHTETTDETKGNAMDRLSFFADVPADEYHQAARDGKFLSSHLLGDFRRSEEHKSELQSRI